MRKEETKMSSNKIFKYEIDVNMERQIIRMPKNAEVLSVGVQDNKVYTWCLFDDEEMYPLIVLIDRRLIAAYASLARA
jgi:hypothetical protein